MRPRLLFSALSGFLLLLPLAPLDPASGAAGPANLVRNGGFEEDADLDLFPDGWRRYGPDVVAGFDAASSSEGARSLVVASALPIKPGGLVTMPVPVPARGVESDVVPVSPGESLLLSLWTHFLADEPPAWIFVPPVSTVGIEYVGLDLPAPHVSVAVPTDRAWTRVDLPLVVPAHVHGIKVRLDVRGPGAYRVDDVVLERVAPFENRLPNAGFETGHYHNAADLWTMPCGPERATWLTALTEGKKALYFLQETWSDCDQALGPRIVLPPGAYRLTGDRFVNGPGIATLELFAYDAQGGLLLHEKLDVGYVGRKIVQERLDACVPEGAQTGQVLLRAAPGRTPMYWDNMRLVRLGDCP